MAIDHDRLIRVIGARLNESLAEELIDHGGNLAETGTRNPETSRDHIVRQGQPRGAGRHLRRSLRSIRYVDEQHPLSRQQPGELSRVNDLAAGDGRRNV